MSLEKRINGNLHSIKQIQVGGFSYNQEYTDRLVRLGFKELDTVYSIEIKTNYGDRILWLKLEDLYMLGQNILKRKPLSSDELIGLPLDIIISENKSLYEWTTIALGPRLEKN